MSATPAPQPADQEVPVLMSAYQAMAIADRDTPRDEGMEAIKGLCESPALRIVAEINLKIAAAAARGRHYLAVKPCDNSVVPAYNIEHRKTLKSHYRTGKNGVAFEDLDSLECRNECDHILRVLIQYRVATMLTDAGYTLAINPDTTQNQKGTFNIWWSSTGGHQKMREILLSIEKNKN